MPDDSARASVVATLPGCTAVLLQGTATPGQHVCKEDNLRTEMKHIKLNMGR